MYNVSAYSAASNLHLKPASKAAAARKEALESAVLNLEEIVDCFSMSGESDYLLRIVVNSIDDYELFLKRTLLHLPGIASVNSRFVLKRVKNTAKLPI